MLTVFQIAEREDCDIEDVYRFGFLHFSTFYDHATQEDWKGYCEGKPIPNYILQMLGYPRNTN